MARPADVSPTIVTPAASPACTAGPKPAGMMAAASTSPASTAARAAASSSTTTTPATPASSSPAIGPVMNEAEMALSSRSATA